MANDDREPLRIDIVSDVVCPWCALGLFQLARAQEMTGIAAAIHFHPFELNPTMPETGQDMREHLAEKYGTSEAESAALRARLESAGAEVGLAFDFSDTRRMVNSFRAHQLIEWADQQGRQPEMKRALLRAYHCDGRDVSDVATLTAIATGAGLDAGSAEEVLVDGTLSAEVRVMEQFWIGKGIRSVPAMVFNLTDLVTGARGVETYANLLAKFSSAAAT